MESRLSVLCEHTVANLSDSGTIILYMHWLWNHQDISAMQLASRILLFIYYHCYAFVCT